MKKNIIQYLFDNANTTIISRGKRLFQDGSIKKFTFDAGLEKAYFMIQGSRLYDTEVSNVFGKIKTYCSCPYDWGGICKHEVAALLYLDNYLEKNPNKISTKLVNKPKKQKKSVFDWQEIPNYLVITEELTASLTDIRTLRAGIYNADKTKEIILTEIKESYAKFTLIEYWEEYYIEFKQSDKKLETRCSCRKQKQGICEHQVQILLYIRMHYKTDFFKNIDPVFLNKIESQTLKEYGLNNEKFSDWFQLDFEDKIKVSPKEKAKGLVKLKKYRNDGEEKLNAILKSNEAGIISHIPDINDSKFEIGYVFLFSEKDVTHKVAIIEPIYGKPNKGLTKLSTFIRKVSEREPGHKIIFSETDEKLIELCKQTSIHIFKEYFNRIGIYDENTDKAIIESIKYFLPKLIEIVENLQNNKYVYKSYSEIKRNDLIPIKTSNITPEIKFKLTDDDTFIKLTAYLKIGNTEISFSDEKLLLPHMLIIDYNNTFYFLKSIKDAFAILEYYKIDTQKTIKQDFDNFFNDYVNPIADYYPVEINLSEYKTITKKLEAKEKRIYISEIGKFVVFKPVVIYDENLSVNILTHGNLIQKKDDRITVSYRDIPFEKEFYSLLKSFHPKFNKQFREDFLHLQIEDLTENYWFFDVFEKFKIHNIEVFGLKDLKNFKYSPDKAKVAVNIKSGQDWFDVKINVKFGDTEISLKDIRKAVMKNDRFVKLGDGTTGILPKEWFEKFEKYFRHGEIKDNDLKISKLKFSIIDKLFDKKSYSEIYKELAEKKAKLKKFSQIKNVRIPKNLKGTLRDYQKSGYNWLNFLDEFKWGGILADDMGLGKTIQILAFLLRQKTKSKKANLIVVPTTLLFNWKNEVAKFSPDLSILFYHGLKRNKDTKEFKKFDLIITTYGTMMRDILILKKYLFNYVILDESQAIKNPGSRRFKASTLLRAKNRLTLTGTPIENNTFDLYAQMDFLNPGFLGNQKHFKDNYSIPIDKNRDPIRAAELQNLITPFILRRTKEQVATELPAKTEDFIYCEPEEEQRKVYDAFRNKYRNYLLNKIEDDGIGKSKIYVIEGLMKLRQICDSPEILSDKEDYGKQSVKVKELIRHIKEKTGKHKILVFSQFVKMLKIIERELKIENIEYEYLDGQSTQKARQASVNNFQENENIRVFLISLKAGGTGVNLTAADYVYIFDPWWNPAVENQAIDRCYRIGQDKKVIAYRMICKNTIEEKIMIHQENKRKVAADIITTDESFVKQLKKDDILKLFE